LWADDYTLKLKIYFMPTFVQITGVLMTLTILKAGNFPRSVHYVGGLSGFGDEYCKRPLALKLRYSS
jgi:hypothetical protein